MSTDIAVTPRKSEVVSFRLPSDELDRLEVAASEAGETISEFLRAALAERMLGPGRILPSSISWLVGEVWCFSLIRSGGGCNRAEVEGQSEFAEVPDFPPRSMSING